MQMNLSMINKEAYIFGLLFLDNGATIFIAPLLNILVSGKTNTAAVLELFDCQDHLADGDKHTLTLCLIYLCIAWNI